MSEPPIRKQEADYTKDVDELIPVAESLADAGTVQQAVDKLLILEKQTRNAADLSSTTRLLIAIISILYRKKEYELLNTNIVILSRKHGQLRQAIQKMVEEAITYLDGLEGETKLKLIETLREVTEGKIFLEVPRARLTRLLSSIKESAGDIATASALVQELQVETFGSMDRREKVDFILEQMRLLRLRGEWEKLAIVSKKINLRWLAGKDNEDLKLRFYGLMILYALQASKYLDLCKYYRSIYDTPSVQADEAQWSAALRNAVFFVILAPYDNEQSDLLNRIMRDEKLLNMGDCYQLAKCFITPELMRWPRVEAAYGPSLRQTRVFGLNGTNGVPGDIEKEDSPLGDQRWEELHKRVVEHNIRTISKYYTRITLSRLGQLLDLEPSQAEEFLSRLVVSKMIYARIDRPAGVASFREPKTTDRVLNEWSSDVGKLLSLVEKTCHLISKEHAVHAALKGQSSKA